MMYLGIASGKIYNIISKCITDATTDKKTSSQPQSLESQKPKENEKRESVSLKSDVSGQERKSVSRKSDASIQGRKSASKSKTLESKKQKTKERIAKIQESIKEHKNEQFKTAVNQLLKKDIYRFIPKKLIDKYKQNKKNKNTDNISWSTEDKNIIQININNCLENLIIKLNNLLTQDHNYTEEKKNNSTKETVTSSYGIYIEVLLLPSLNDYLSNKYEIETLYTKLNDTKYKMRNFVVEGEGKVGKETLLFVIRMLKNQIKKLKEYNIFPNLKLDKKIVYN